DGPAGPCPSNLTREARRRLPRFRQEIKNRGQSTFQKSALTPIFYFLAEAVRFELTNGFPRRQFSRLLPSTTRPRFLGNRIIHKSSPAGRQETTGADQTISNHGVRKLCSNSAAGCGLPYK